MHLRFTRDVESLYLKNQSNSKVASVGLRGVWAFESGACIWD